ncbi:hypothetical protein AB0B79_26570 [Streptomyces sp. NPDC039022]|uniref:hypothetical protein n=1 Tax=unclassified Streptomyces TaxID=2593676 RepID=UPI0033E6E9F1
MYAGQEGVRRLLWYYGATPRLEFTGRGRLPLFLYRREAHRESGPRGRRDRPARGLCGRPLFTCVPVRDAPPRHHVVAGGVAGLGSAGLESFARDIGTALRRVEHHWL